MFNFPLDGQWHSVEGHVCAQIVLSILSTLIVPYMSPGIKIDASRFFSYATVNEIMKWVVLQIETTPETFGRRFLVDFWKIRPKITTLKTSRATCAWIRTYDELSFPGLYCMRYSCGISSTKSLIQYAPWLAIELLITQIYLEHRLSAQLQLYLHSRLNTWLQWIGQRRLQDEMRII